MEYTTKQVSKVDENYSVFRKEDLNQDVLEFFTKNQHLNDLAYNFQLFLKELGAPISAPLVPTVNYFTGFPLDFVPVILESGWSCHITAPWYSRHNPCMECYFGFADVYEKDQYVNTYSHSFIVTSNNEIVDIQYNYHVRDFDQLKSTLRNYYGVLIPKTIIKEVFALAPKGQIQNLGGFFKSKIFQSRTLTVEWIEKIKKAHVNTEH